MKRKRPHVAFWREPHWACDLRDFAAGMGLNLNFIVTGSSEPGPRPPRPPSPPKMAATFERLAAQAAAAREEVDPSTQRAKRHRTEQDELRRRTEEMTPADAIARVLLADADRDYFRMLGLPPPDVDALGRPTWAVTPAEVSKAYRRLSVLVHPDKNPGDEARAAFEALNRAHRLLKDAGELEAILKEHLDRAKARKEEVEARATPGERIAMGARQLEEAKALRKAEGEAMGAEIVRQMREKQEKARKRREAAERHRRRAEEGQGEEPEGEEPEGGAAAKQGSDSDDDEAQRRRQALAKRRKQQQGRRPTAP